MSIELFAPKWGVIFLVFSIFLMSNYPVLGEEITYIEKSQQNGNYFISWNAYGKQWKVSIEKNLQLGDSIQVIDVAVKPGNERLKYNAPNCYYRGSLVDYRNVTISGTYTHINLCDTAVPFTGFVSTRDFVYKIRPNDTSWYSYEY